MKTRDWKHAEEVKRQWEDQGKKPSGPAVLVKIEDFKTKFIQNMKIEGKSHETIRKMSNCSSKWKCRARKGIRFLTELDLPLLEEFRSTWPDGDLAKQKKQERLRSVFKYARSRRIIRTIQPWSWAK